MSFNPADPIGSAFADIIGRTAWLVRSGYGAMLTLEFGAPCLETREPVTDAKHDSLRRRRVTVRGQWHLWIHSCNWSLADQGSDIANSEASATEIEAAVALLDSQILARVELDRERRSTWFGFDLGGGLKTTPWPNTDACEAEQWLLFMPDGHVLAYRADGAYSYGPANLPPGEERWVQLPA